MANLNVLFTLKNMTVSNPNYEGDTSGREIRVSKLLKAPIYRVWDAWTKSDQVSQWWGPRGVIIDIHKMDVRPDGDWLLDITLADGKKFPNKSTFREIIPNTRIVFEHFAPNYLATVDFESKGNDTFINWVMIIDTKKLYDTLVNTFKADQGQLDNVEKLAEYLEKNQAKWPEM